MKDFEAVVIAMPPVMFETTLWHDTDSCWWLRCQNGHLGHPDEDQVLGRVSIVCPEEGCASHFTLIPLATVESFLETGEGL